MIINTGATTKNLFNYYGTYQSQNESLTYYNSGLGSYHSWIYIIEGTLDTYVTSGPEPELLPGATLVPLSQNQLYNISHTKDNYVTSKTWANGCSFITLHPLSTSNLNVTLESGAKVITVGSINSTVDTTILCVTGPVDVNGTEVKSLQHATVLKGTTATLTLTGDDICLLITN